MTTIILILLGLFVKIVEANNWFIIPTYVAQVLFIMAGINLIYVLFISKATLKQIKRGW